jgi:hypothetical protein
MPGSDSRPTIGYVVSTWPRLSQTFVLNEVLALERLDLRLRIFSGKDPGEEPVHADVAQVRADVTYLSFRRHWKPSLRANVRLACDLPGRYVRTLLAALRFALRYRRWGVVHCFFQAAYLADLLRRDPVSHLHAHFATAPALVAMFTHELVAPRSPAMLADALDVLLSDPELHERLARTAQDRGALRHRPQLRAPAGPLPARR